MAPPLLTVRQLGLRFGDKTIFRDLNFSIHNGEHICLVGRNGSGKSTLFKVLAGLTTADTGELFIQPGTKMAYLPQEPDFSAYTTAIDYVVAGLFPDQAHEIYRAEAALSLWHINPLQAPQTLSGGGKRRLALARVFAGDPDVLLLDEPTNHLDLPTIQALEKMLSAFRGCFILISHDRAFLQHLTNTTLWLDRGIMRRLNEGYQAFAAWSTAILEQEERAREKMDKLIAQETTWSYQGITARCKRNQGRLKRLYELRKQRADMMTPQGRAQLEIDSGTLSSQLVIEATNISKSYNHFTIIKGFSTRILRGDRVGIIGPNGAGKSTLLRLLTGEMTPDSGCVRLGQNLNIVYFDQTRQRLDPEKTLWETLCERETDHVWVRGHPRHVVSYLRDFLFDAGQARSPVNSLSGGEKSRLLLAKMLAQPSNLLVLDEPTNDLDLDTLDLLQDVLSEYEGTLILVSHDRDFLDQLVTSTIVFEGNGHLTEYAGGYTDYLRQRAHHKGTTPLSSPISKPVKTTAKIVKPSGAKLSYTQQRRYEEIPHLLQALERRVKAIEEELSTPELYQKDPEAFQQLSHTYQELKAQIEAAELEWLEIAERKIALENKGAKRNEP